MPFAIRFLLTLLLSLTLAACATHPIAPQSAPLPDGASSQLTLEMDDGARLHATWWQPTGTASAVIVLLHGTSLHGGLYAPWANFLKQRGYAVLAPDLRGWGQSMGEHTPGYVTDYATHVHDVGRLLAEARQRHPGRPIYLQGDAMGGTIAVYSQLTTPTAGQPLPVDGLILNSPAMRITLFGMPEVISRQILWSGAQVGKMLPDSRAPLVVQADQALRLLIRDPALRQRMLADPLVVKTLPAAYLTGITAAMRKVEKNLPEVKAPLLVVHGEDDSLIPPSSSQRLIAGIGSSDKTLLIYAGVGHSTLLDSGHEKPWQDIADWLDRHVAMGVVQAH